MRKVIRDILPFELKSYNDKKSELDDFFNSIIHELADNEMYDRVRKKKVEFMDWLRQHYLFQFLTDIYTAPCTELDWKCRTELLNYLCKFDMFLLQCIGRNEEVEMSDNYLRRKMSEFNEEYNELS